MIVIVSGFCYVQPNKSFLALFQKSKNQANPSFVFSLSAFKAYNRYLILLLRYGSQV